MGDRRTEAQATGEWIERLAILMDRAIPLGKRFGIGLDSILGLIPGVGDVAGGLVSGLIIYQAYRVGIPKPTLLRMLANVGIDSTVGAIPLLGDLFDLAFKSNMRNLELYRNSVAGAHRSRSDWTFLVLLLLGLCLVIAIPILLVVWAVQWVSPL